MANQYATVPKCIHSDITNSEGINLHTRKWIPTTTPKAMVILLHGFSEHLDWYEEIANVLIQRSIIVFGHDLHGFGRSGGVRCYLKNFQNYVNDCIQNVNALKEEYPNLPLFCVCHSLGGTIALKALMTKPDIFQGVVFIAPCIVPSPRIVTPTRMFFAKLLAILAPNCIVGKMEYNLATRDLDMIERMKKDPYRWHKGAKAKPAMLTFAVMQEIDNNLSSITCPFLTLHGSNDVVVDIASSKRLFENASTVDKTIKIFENAYHCLHVEISEVRQQIFRDMSDWIDHRTGSLNKLT